MKNVNVPLRTKFVYKFNEQSSITLEKLNVICKVTFSKLQKKSREESSGAGSGVEILINEPYEDGPGGSGQYTKKIYHVGSHLPGTHNK